MITPERLEEILSDDNLNNKAWISEAVRFYNKQSVMYQSYDSIDIFKNSELGKNLQTRVNNTGTFANLMNSARLPVSTVKGMSKIAVHFGKLFSAEDRYISTSSDESNEKYDAIQSKYGLEYWQSAVYDAYNEDSSALQLNHFDSDGYYSQIIQTKSIVAINYDEDNNVIYCIWSAVYNGVDVYECVDSDSYTRILKSEENAEDGGSRYSYYIDDDGENVISPVIENGVCPIQHISNELLRSDNKTLRKNTFTESLGDFEELLVLKIMRNALDGKQYPVSLVYKNPPCNNVIGNTQCKGGYLVYKASNGEVEAHVEDSNGDIMRCPMCNSRSEEGFGGTVSRRAPQDNEEADVIADSLIYRTLDTGSIESVDTRIRELEELISNDIIGVTDTANQNQQHNEKRVLSSFDSKKTAIVNKTTVFAPAMEFSFNQQLFFINGNSSVNAIVNLGTDFFLNTVSDYINQGSEQMKIGVDYTGWRRSIVCIRYESNEDEKRKNLQFLKLEEKYKPYRNTLPESVETLYSSDKITFESFQLYTNFDMILVNFNDGLSETEDITTLADKDLFIKFEEYIKTFHEKNKLKDE